MLWALRITFWLQFLLGLGLSRILAGMAPSLSERNVHLVVGLIAAALALVVLRPTRERGYTGISAAASFFPLLPLLFGLYIRFIDGMIPIVIVHMLLGITAVALVEIAIARQGRRSLSRK